ncbi:HdeD family acid-resistance protein [Streptomyces sp. NPDC002851]
MAGRRTPPTTSGEGRKLRRSFGLLAALGAILVLAGLVGLVYVGVATLTTMLLFGWLLLIGGLVGLVQSVQLRRSNFFWLGVVVAALNLAAGVVVLRHPEVSAEAFTLFAALLFLTGGVFRLVGSLVVRGPQVGVTLVQGAFGLLIGVLILGAWPSSSLYVIGTFFSLALLFDGLGLLAMGIGGRHIVNLVGDREGGAGPGEAAVPGPTPDDTETPGASPASATGGKEQGKAPEADNDQSHN